MWSPPLWACLPLPAVPVEGRPFVPVAGFPLWRTPGSLPGPSWHGSGKQVLAWLMDVARTSLRMPARRPLGRSPVPWPRRRPIPLAPRRAVIEGAVERQGL